MSKIIGLKLVTGEEIVAEDITIEAFAASERHDTGRINLRRPLVVGPGPNGQIQFFKWPTVASTESHVIRREDYISEPFEVHKEIEDAYIQLTSGLVLAAK